MTENERKLLQMIREHKDPERALQITVHLILQHLEQHGSSAEPFPAAQKESS